LDFEEPSLGGSKTRERTLLELGSYTGFRGYFGFSGITGTKFFAEPHSKAISAKKWKDSVKNLVPYVSLELSECQIQKSPITQQPVAGL
jgi:hypothetical protein